MKSQDRAGGEYARRLGIQLGQERLKGARHLVGIGALEDDVDLIRAGLANDPRQLEKAAKNTEGVLGTPVYAIETECQQSLGIGSRQFDGIHQQAAVLAK